MPASQPASRWRRLGDWVMAAAPDPARRVALPGILAAVVAVWLVDFGWATWRAVEVLHDPEGGFPSTYGGVGAAVWGVAWRTLQTTVACSLGLALVAWAMGDRRSLGRLVGRRRWRTELSAAAWFVGLTGLAFALGTRFAMHQYPAALGPYEFVPALVGSVLAGVGEQIVLVVVPAVLLRAAGAGWGLIMALSVLLRLSFHVYYGWPVIFLAIWAAGVVVVHLRTGAVWGLIGAHVWWDIRGAIAIHVSEGAGYVLTVTSLLAAYAVIGSDVVAWNENRKARRAASAPSHA